MENTTRLWLCDCDEWVFVLFVSSHQLCDYSFQIKTGQRRISIQRFDQCSFTFIFDWITCLKKCLIFFVIFQIFILPKSSVVKDVFTAKDSPIFNAPFFSIAFPVCICFSFFFSFLYIVLCITTQFKLSQRWINHQQFT